MALQSYGGFPLSIVRLTGDAVIKYTCAMCNMLLKDPVQCSCGHRFCMTCLTAFFVEENARPCPQCRDDSPEENPEMLLKDDLKFIDRAFKRECDALPTKCAEIGCQWEGLLKNYEAHTKGCQFKTKLCVLCNKSIPESKFSHHETDECPEGETVCPKCNSAMRRMLFKSHMDNCQGSSKDSKSESADVRCAIVGCKTTTSRKNLKAHKTEAAPYHVDQINERLLLLENKFITNLSAIEETIRENQMKREINDKGGGATGSSTKHSISTTADERLSKIEEKTNQLEGVCAVMNAEFKKCITEVKTLMHENADQKNKCEKLEIELKNMEKQIMLKDVTLAEQDMRIQMLENQFFDGLLVWKINEFTRRRQEAVLGKTNSIYSSPFYTSRTGYKLCARIYLNGDGMGKNTHISLFIVVMKGMYDALLIWPFHQKVTLTILDQAGKDHVVDAFQPDTTSSSFKRPTSDMNIASGCPLFMPLSYLDMKGRDYVKDDCLFVKVVVDSRDLPTF